MGFDIGQLFNENAVTSLTNYLIEFLKTEQISYQETDTGFKPISSVNRAKGDRAFLIGFIPPDVNVNYIPIKVEPGKFLRGKKAVRRNVSSGGGGGTKTKYTAKTPPVLDSVTSQPDYFWDELCAVSDRLGVSPLWLARIFIQEGGFTAQSMNISDSGNIVARGLIQFQAGSLSFKPGEWENLSTLTEFQQLAYVERYFTQTKKNAKINKWESEAQLYQAVAAPSTVGKINDDDTAIYSKPSAAYNGNEAVDLNKDGKITRGELSQTLDDASKREFVATAWIITNISAAIGRQNATTSFTIEAFKKVDPEKRKPAEISATTTSTPSGGGDGLTASESVKDYPDDLENPPGLIAGKLNDVDIEENDPYKQYGRHISVDLDREFKYARKAKNAINRDIDLMTKTPTLMLLVNPKTITRRHEFASDVQAARRNPIVSVWLEQPMKISGSGSTSAQYAVDSNGNGGLSNLNRVFSLSYENLMSLAMIYRNNGWIYSDYGDFTGFSLPTLPCSVFIYYDGVIYIGSFDSFKINDAADKPYSLEYDFDFTVRYEVNIADSVGESLLQGNSASINSAGY